MSEQILETSRGPMSFEQVGEGPDLVVLHSLLTDRGAFEPVLSDLAAARRVTLVDLPGFGRSAPARTIDDFADLIGALLAEGGFDPATTALLGNGLGAFVALGTAIRHGGSFDRLVLVGCGLAFPEGARDVFDHLARRVEEGGMEAVVDVAVRRIFPESYLEQHPEVIEPRRRALVRMAPDAFAAACRALHLVDFREQAGAVGNPTLIVVGADDLATPPELARDLHTAIAGSQLIEMEAVGHAPQMQDPGRFVATITPFLEEVR